MSTCGLYYNSIMGAVGPALSGGDADLSGLPSPGITEMCANIVQGFLQDGMAIQAHRRIMCELMCCCNRSTVPAAAPEISEPGENMALPGRQACVEQAVNGPVPYRQAGLDYNPHMAEVSYNMQFPEPVPLMDYIGGSAMTPRNPGQMPQWPLYSGRPLHYYQDFGRIIGRVNREFDPRTRLLRDAANQPRFRRPDIVVRRDPSNPLPFDYPNSIPGIGEIIGDNSNILAVFEMKFPGDRPRPGQYQDYRRIAGPGRFFELTTQPNSCNCQARRSGQNAFAPVTAPYSSPAGERNLMPTLMPAPPVPAPAPQPAPEIPPDDGGGFNWPEINWPTFPLPTPGRCPRYRGVPVC